MFNDNNDMVIPDTFHDGPTLSYTTTSIPSTSSSHTSKPKDASTSSYLDIPSSSSFRRPSRPSLDSTYTDLSELSFASADLHSQSHPLMRAPSNTTPQSTPTTFRARLQRLYVHNYGALLVLLAQFFGVLMNLSTRMLEQNGSHGAGMHPFQILFVRQFITSLTCTLWATLLPIVNPQSKNLIADFPLGPKSTSVRLLLLTRGVSGFLGVFGMYFSLLYLPLSEATVLTFLAPILTCYLCSWVIPGEKFSRQQQLAGLVSLVGVVFIARPANFFVSPASSDGGSGEVASNSTVAETAPTEGYAHPNPSPSEHLLAIGIALLGVIGSTGRDDFDSRNRQSSTSVLEHQLLQCLLHHYEFNLPTSLQRRQVQTPRQLDGVGPSRISRSVRVRNAVAVNEGFGLWKSHACESRPCVGEVRHGSGRRR